MSLLEDAIAYAVLGWRVFPQAGKEPMVRRGVHAGTTDPEQIVKWWRRWPCANIGLSAGDQWWALDVDPDKGGVETMQRLAAQYGRLPETVTNRTGGGGWHVLLTMPPIKLRNWVGGASKDWPYLGVDIRAEGAAITAPPSIHPDTRQRYRWLKGCSPLEPDARAIAATPDWLLKLITPPPLPPRVEVSTPIDEGWGPRPKYSRAAIESACQNIRGAPNGQQERILNDESYMIGRLVGGGLMAEATAKSWLIAAGMDMQSYNARNPWTYGDVVKKVVEGLQDGKLNPNVRALAS